MIEPIAAAEQGLVTAFASTKASVATLVVLSDTLWVVAVVPLASAVDTDHVPDATCATPVEDEELIPVPPYVEPIAVACHVPPVIVPIADNGRSVLAMARNAGAPAVANSECVVVVSAEIV